MSDESFELKESFIENRVMVNLALLEEIPERCAQKRAEFSFLFFSVSAERICIMHVKIYLQDGNGTSR